MGLVTFKADLQLLELPERFGAKDDALNLCKATQRQQKYFGRPYTY